MAQSPKTSQGGASLSSKKATTIHEDSAVYTVPTSTELDYGGGRNHPCPPLDCLKGDGRITHAIILTDSMGLLQKEEWEAQTGMCEWSTHSGCDLRTCRSEGKRTSR